MVNGKRGARRRRHDNEERASEAKKSLQKEKNKTILLTPRIGNH